MKEKKSKIIAAILVAAMVFLYLSILFYASYMNMKKENEADHKEDTHISEKVDKKDNDLSADEFEPVDVSDKIMTINDINEEKEDSAIRETEVEQVYVNTIELLPSVLNAREYVPKEKVDTSEFPDSYALTNVKTMELDGVSVSFPAEVYLYNTGTEKSSELKVSASVEGNESLIKSVGWTSSRYDIIRVSNGGGLNTTIQLVNPSYTGKVNVDVVVTYYETKTSTTTKTLPMTVVVEGISYGNNVLHDKNGNELYLDQAGKKIALVSDYGRATGFYGQVKTTGWQDLFGSRFYFDSNSQVVKGHQIIGGIPYEFDEEGRLISNQVTFGIDVSKWQKEIDWSQVAASGVDFAIIRCGYRGSASGTLVEDPFFKRNIEGAKANGIKVGVYFFTQAINEREAIEEASMALSLCKNYDLDLPIYIDSENAVDGRANNLSREDRTLCLKAFCETINASGKTGGVYASKSWYYDKVYASELEMYNIWVAQYNTECNYTGKTDFWQFSSRETIAGITGYVDVNVVRSTNGR